MTRDKLPTFTVHHLERDRAIGTADRPLWLGEGYLGHLLLPDGRFVAGRFVNVDLQSLTATFIPASAVELVLLDAGQTYQRFDAYWGHRAALVLDRQHRWTQRRFRPVDAIAHARPGATVVGKLTDQEDPEAGTLIKGGWDHEHCEICCKTISSNTDPVAMFLDPEHWLCRECYATYVVPRSFDFIGDDDPGCG